MYMSKCFTRTEYQSSSNRKINVVASRIFRLLWFTNKTVSRILRTIRIVYIIVTNISVKIPLFQFIDMRYATNQSDNHKTSWS